MKNLHNWALISEDAALLAAAKTEDLPNVIHRLRKYREAGETIEACMPAFAAIIALSVTFPEVLKVSFKSQKIKTEWALFCKMQGWSDLSGRIQKALTVVSMETGALHEVTRDSRMDPPARQTWLPWTGHAENILHELTRAYASQADIAKTYRLRQSEDDVAKTYWLEQQFSFGGAIYVVDGKARLRPGTVQDMARDTFSFKGETFNKSFTLRAAEKAIESEMKNKQRRKTAKTHKEQTMNLTQKASAFFGNLKSVGLDLLRVQRGRATLHSAKRVIFAALPIKWGFLARLTGKAKKVENHPLTDLGLALALHGATNFAISDPVKREKYLKYTEEMLVAAGYSASLKMLPVEDMLDKIFTGVNESEAMSKLKELVKDSGEPEIKVKQ